MCPAPHVASFYPIQENKREQRPPAWGRSRGHSHFSEETCKFRSLYSAVSCSPQWLQCGSINTLTAHFWPVWNTLVLKREGGEGCKAQRQSLNAQCWPRSI